MLRLKWIVGAAAVLLTAFDPGRAADEDTYDLRGPAPQEKQVFVSTGTMTMKDAELTLKSGGEKVSFKMKVVGVQEEETRVLAVKGRDVTKCQTKIGKSRSEITPDGQDESMTEPDPLEGETVISERTADGKWKNVLVDTKPDEKQKKALANFHGLENDDDRFPEEKVKVGHTWTVDAAAMSVALDHEFTDLKGKVKQKFVKLERVGGEECAVVESSGTITGKTKDDGELTGDVELALKFTTWKSLKTGLTVREKYEGTFKLAGTSNSDGVKADATLTGSIAGETTTKLK